MSSPDDEPSPTPSARPEWLRYCGPDWYDEQDENGIDLSLIRENLKLMPLERIRRADPQALLASINKMISALSAAGVEFVVIGGWAAAMHGSPASPDSDLDICYGRQPGDPERLAAVLRQLEALPRGAPNDLSFPIDAQLLAWARNLMLRTTAGNLDLIGLVEPIGGYDELVKNAETMPFGDFAVKVASLEDLIRVKQHINRPKDRDSLMHLLAIKRVREEQQRGE